MLSTNIHPNAKQKSSFSPKASEETYLHLPIVFRRHQNVSSHGNSRGGVSRAPVRSPSRPPRPCRALPGLLRPRGRRRAGRGGHASVGTTPASGIRATAVGIWCTETPRRRRRRALHAPCRLGHVGWQGSPLLVHPFLCAVGPQLHLLGPSVRDPSPGAERCRSRPGPVCYGFNDRQPGFPGVAAHVHARRQALVRISYHYQTFGLPHVGGPLAAGHLLLPLHGHLRLDRGRG